ncbi:RcnB family protein [Novosphingobium mangrovi (ex Huang et al. 2023)]|uniref:RcnB family protein n=1 Tax=Novosphingobium mangrovi (ex Huang et al. 2023) TaxID=2976432 RepID=A0ABT2I217_9SPHN|nr:RcnB family protein [Novosphingobium mangrovi (ex Huang et al. 2023)]MCT2398839.1 RcnB family protein [Novosphingobium mangrovi (ex Huang et al. 2023)]
MRLFSAALIAASLAVSGMAAPAMAQQQKPPQQQSHNQNQNKGPSKSGQGTAKKVEKKKVYKTFRKGEKFDRRYARNYQIVDYRKYKRLPAPRKGYRYVRAGSDVLLIGTSTFKVYAVYSGLIR